MSAPATDDLRTALADLAKRSLGLVKACQNEESIKLYLVLPLLRALGYDSGDPLEVYPNHETDPIDGPDGPKVFTADFAILRDGSPIIAVGAGRTGIDLDAKRVRIATYFSAWASTKLAIVGNGILFELFVDSVEPGTMDAAPFLTLDLETIASGGVPDEVVDTLVYATKAHLDPDKIAECAHLQLVRKRLRAAFVEEAQAPSEDLCRAMMARIGFPGVRREVIERHYAGLVKSAFEEALVLPVVQRLKAGGVGDGVASGIKMDVSQGLAGAQHEVTLVGALRRRLAYLAESEAEYAAIERVSAVMSIGKMTVCLDGRAELRVCDVIAGAGAGDKYVFADGDVVAVDLAAIDVPLRGAFLAAVAKADPAKVRKAG